MVKCGMQKFDVICGIFLISGEFCNVTAPNVGYVSNVFLCDLIHELLSVTLFIYGPPCSDKYYHLYVSDVSLVENMGSAEQEITLCSIDTLPEEVNTAVDNASNHLACKQNVDSKTAELLVCAAEAGQAGDLKLSLKHENVTDVIPVNELSENLSLVSEKKLEEPNAVGAADATKLQQTITEHSERNPVDKASLPSCNGSGSKFSSESLLAVTTEAERTDFESNVSSLVSASVGQKSLAQTSTDEAFSASAQQRPTVPIRVRGLSVGYYQSIGQSVSSSYWRAPVQVPSSNDQPYSFRYCSLWFHFLAQLVTAVLSFSLWHVLRVSLVLCAVCRCLFVNHGLGNHNYET